MTYNNGTGDAPSTTSPDRASITQSYGMTGSSSSDRLMYRDDALEDLSTGAQKTPVRDKSLSKAPRRPGASLNDRAIRKRRAALKFCADALSEMCEMDDVIAKGNAVIEIRNSLKLMWEMSESDDSKAFEEMVAVLRAALHYDEIFSDESQLGAVRSVFSQMADNPDIDDYLANELTEELIRGGVDVFRGID